MNIYSASLLSLLPAVQCLVSGLPSQQVPLTGVNGQNHLAIPHLGFGTWNLSPDDHNASAAVEHAIKTGYRHIDCAAAYNNQEDVGRGIARGLEAVGLRREDIWVTSKLWNDQ
jgi:alcohol dehydrogenase (NADP+)